MSKEHSFGILELTDLVEKKKIVLPNVQRGFVWKPSQIENLWDSLLRGYPVGAIVLAPGNDGWNLLDGQQRLTSMCLGLGRDSFREGNEQIKIFIDIMPPDDVEDPRKFIFRVITHSHPWGYQRNDNTKTLDQSTIRKALEIYNVKDPMAEEDLSNFFPYDAKLPIPFEYFVNATSAQEILEKAKSTMMWQAFLKHCDSDVIDEVQVRGRIEKLLVRTSEILKSGGDFEQRIAALYLDLDVFHHNTEPQIIPPVLAMTQDDEEESLDEIENLFVRLNAGGTPLRGEELNYSVLKSHIVQSLQENIEKSCEPFYDPARFITIIYRLFQAQPGRTGGGEPVSMRIKPKQFQRVMANKQQRDDFLQFLSASLNTKLVEQETLLIYAKNVLTFDSDRVPFGLPYPVAMRLSDQAPEVVFLLLYRIWFKQDRFTYDKAGDELYRKMIGVISLLTWLGKENGKKGYRKLLINLWPAAKELPADLFWSAATIRRGQIGGILPSKIPTINDLENSISFIKSPPSKWSRSLRDLTSDPFLSKTIYNRSLLLFAQRKFIEQWFPERQFHLSDTDTPFDWDHISPHRLIDKKKGIPDQVKTCYNMIGNFRAWPYSLNRMDQDDVPSIKLNPEEEKKQRYCDLINSIKRNAPRVSRDTLSPTLMEWSFCNKDWLDCNDNDLKQRKNWKTICESIINRNFEIFREWYQSLKIESLRPNPFRQRFEDALNLKQWKADPEFCIEDFNLDNRSYFLKKINSFNLPDTELYFYIGYPRTEGEGLDILEQDAIEFGLYEKSIDKFIDKLRVPDKFSTRYTVYPNRFVECLFTLVSDDEASYRRLFKGFWIWLNDFPREKGYQTEIKGLAKEFASALKGNYANLSQSR